MNKPELKAELMECGSLNEIWMRLDDFYDLDIELGKATKTIIVENFVDNFETIITVTRTPEREEEEEEEEEPSE